MQIANELNKADSYFKHSLLGLLIEHMLVSFQCAFASVLKSFHIGTGITEKKEKLDIKIS